MSDLSLLKKPLTVKTFTFPNRYVAAPLDLQHAGDNGLVTDTMLEAYRRRTGPALTVVEHSYVMKNGRWNTRQLAIDRDECLPGLRRLAEVIRANGQTAVIQLSHAGSAADPRMTGTPSFAPSAINHPVHDRPTPLAMDAADIDGLRAGFTDAALRAQQAGFDGVELHGAHGYLLSQFFSPLTNHRRDAYGGSPENRGRLAVEIVRDVRRAAGDRFLILFRLGADDYIPGGTTAYDARLLVPLLAEAGMDILDVSSGLKGSRSFIGKGFFRDLLRRVGRVAAVPVIGVGSLEDPCLAADVLAAGEADMIALGRSIVQEPALVSRILAAIN